MDKRILKGAAIFIAVVILLVAVYVLLTTDYDKPSGDVPHGTQAQEQGSSDDVMADDGGDGASSGLPDDGGSGSNEGSGGSGNDTVDGDDEGSGSSGSHSSDSIDMDGSFTKKEDVALYIATYKRLPNNFITKNEARALGWDGGSVEKYAKGKAIGGDVFGNYEKRLPKKSGRIYYECDIDTLGKSSRGAKRIVFSNDGLIYYTSDHYETFTLIYGEP